MSGKHHREANFDRLIECIRQYQDASRDRAAEHKRQWQERNAETVVECRQQWIEDRLKRAAEWQRQWIRDNPGRATDRKRRYYEANRERIAERSRRWRKANPEKVAEYRHRRRAQKLDAEGSLSAEDWQSVLDYYDGLGCLACGDVQGPLTIDHVIPLVKGGAHDIHNVQPLCLSCNSKKYTKTTDYRPMLPQPKLFNVNNRST
jgi:5-methylcytosine-specific restriction endonuclease McrA